VRDRVDDQNSKEEESSRLRNNCHIFGSVVCVNQINVRVHVSVNHSDRKFHLCNQQILV
jgi:hypothetical protein